MHDDVGRSKIGLSNYSIDELDCRCSKSEGILEVKDLFVETGCMRSRAELPTDVVMGVTLCRWSER